jgi:predicted anti-sigma-YlaC factor YlaD
MHYSEPYEPSEELIEAHKERIRKRHLRIKRKCKSYKSLKEYQPGVTQVPSVTRPVVGTHYQ